MNEHGDDASVGRFRGLPTKGPFFNASILRSYPRRKGGKNQGRLDFDLRTTDEINTYEYIM